MALRPQVGTLCVNLQRMSYDKEAINAVVKALYLTQTAEVRTQLALASCKLPAAMLKSAPMLETAPMRCSLPCCVTAVLCRT